MPSLDEEADTLGSESQFGDRDDGWQLSLQESTLAGEVALSAVLAAVLPETSQEVELGRYRVLRKLGAGGMGDVYEARRIGSDESVALKTLMRPSPRQLVRFKQEFRLLADLPHPNLVRLHELDVRSADRAFFTMEIVAGQPFVSWVRRDAREGSPPDVARLEDAFYQLSKGLAHLHDHGCVHRDIKPSNVLVRADGHVVILDFGLAFDLDEPDRGVTFDDETLGTPAYMAPEQARNERVGSAADCYAVGVMLHQCLTGRLPHQGTALQVLSKKQDTLAPDPDLDRAPSHLRRACLELLARDPTRRPGAARLLEVFRREDRVVARASSGAAKPGIFVGRRAELDALDAAFARLGAGDGAVIVHLRGRSGYGKSALAGRFAARVRERDGAIVLTGRCREREILPYKGVDAVVDGLSAHLRHLPPDELEALRPTSASVLARVFPVLDGIWKDDSTIEQLGPSEVRNVSWAALREVLGGVARRRRLVVHIDDFQWADVDSARLLHGLLRPPDAPAAMLLIAYRSEASEAGSSEALGELEADEDLGVAAATIVDVGPLSTEHARELTDSLLLRRESGPTHTAERLESIVLRSGGIPFFIGQMVLAPREQDRSAELVVDARIDELAESVRRILEVVAVSNGPLTTQLVLELCPGARLEDVGHLCTMRLLVHDGSDAPQPEVRVEAAHDRVRETVLARLDADEQTRLHAAIGGRLLAQCQANTARADTLFIAVDHLDSGVSELAALGHDERATLTDLNCQVGERALASGAWVTALRYFEFARRCVQPWLDDARAGRGEHARCTAAAYGLAQALAMCEDPRSDEVFEELIGWSHSVRDRSRYLLRYLGLLEAASRWGDCFARGVAGLAELGVRLPLKPSLPRLLWTAWSAVRLVRALELDRLIEMPEVEDDHLRAVMGILGVIGTPALGIGHRSVLLIVERHARLTLRHGYQAWTIPGLANLAIGVSAIGKITEAGALSDDLLSRLSKRRPADATSLAKARAMTGVFVYPRCRPLRQMADYFAEGFGPAMSLGDRRLTEWYLALTAVLSLDAGATPLPELTRTIEDLRRRSQTSDSSEFMRITDLCLSVMRVLIEGPEHAEVLPPETPGWSQLTVHVATVRHVRVAVAFADFERAWSYAETIFEDFEEVLVGYYHTAFYALYCSIVMCERAQAGRVSRRAALRTTRRLRRVTRRWAKGCPANYEPMDAVVHAELLGLRGKFEVAMTQYERAVEIARANQMWWLQALASDRLARLAERHGHHLVARGAWTAAREAYASWGAQAVVARIDGDIEASQG